MLRVLPSSSSPSALTVVRRIQKLRFLHRASSVAVDRDNHDDDDDKRATAAPILTTCHWKPNGLHYPSSSSMFMTTTTTTSIVRFSTSTSSSSSKPTPPPSNSNEDSEPDDSTFRSRMSARTASGRKAAKRGAKSVKGMLKTYGPVFIGTYASLYLGTLASLFGGMQSGALDPAYMLSYVTGGSEDSKSTVDLVVSFLDHYEWTKSYAPMVEKHPYVANLAAAWIVTKFTEPIRFGATIVIVPRLARYFGYVVKEEDDGYVHVAKPDKEQETNAATMKADDGIAKDEIKADDGIVSDEPKKDEIKKQP